MKPIMTEIRLTTTGASFVPGRHVTLLIGPNNAGKSAVLEGCFRELIAEDNNLQTMQPGPISSIEVEMPSTEELSEFIASRSTLREPGSYPHAIYYEPTYEVDSGGVISQSQVVRATSLKSHFGAGVASLFAMSLGPEGRGGVLQSQSVPDLLMGHHQGRSPMQKLWGDRELEQTISAYMQRAFGQGLIVNRHAGAQVHLHIGELEGEEPRLGEKSDYLERLMKLPRLASQGSGMQAFMGTILTVASTSLAIVMLDEPEAFLHPPQARLLGEVVVEMARTRGIQVIVATHSDDFMQGVLNASRDDSDASIVRITRTGESSNRIAQISPSTIRSLFRDPLLRFSRIMDGLFYRGVILCESDSDCTYYSASLDVIEEEDRSSSSDILFAHCGGKDRLKKAYEALSAAAVPTAVIADIDLLADRAKFKALFEAMGGDFEVCAARYNVLESSVRNNLTRPSRADARRKSLEIIDSSDSEHLSRHEFDEIVKSMKVVSGWQMVKRRGEGAIDGGDPTVAFRAIVEAARHVGLYILTNGELERFHTEVPGNKQEWLREVLEKQLFRNSPAAHALLRDVREFIVDHQ